MNSDGSIAEESVYYNILAEAKIFAYSIVKKYGECIAVCESTATTTKHLRNIILVSS